MQGSWEVELKFHVDDLETLVERLSQLEFVEQRIESHEDTYFRHPSRNFRDTDEAFRIRRVDDWACVTYKGPRESGPVKTREEIELSIQSAEFQQWEILLRRLGFEPLPPVRKSRKVFQSTAEDWRGFLVVLDSVENLGEFAEVEALVVKRENLDQARSQVTSLAAQLGLSRVQPKSYLSQLLGGK